MVSSVYCRAGPWIGEWGFGERIQNEQTQEQFQQETASEEHGTREREPNERRKKLSLLQMQRGEVIKCRQI